MFWCIHYQIFSTTLLLCYVHLCPPSPFFPLSALVTRIWGIQQGLNLQFKNLTNGLCWPHWQYSQKRGYGWLLGPCVLFCFSCVWGRKEKYQNTFITEHKIMRNSEILTYSSTFDQVMWKNNPATHVLFSLLQTYNQSQSNKRSIHKAISGNKMLHFYQHSPRMIPEGINPKLHKMFITAEKYEPSDSRMLSKERRCSSLQHKSALFSCVTGKRIMVFF